MNRLSCENTYGMDFAKAIPDALLPPETPRKDYLQASALLMARLYLDKTVEYPPDMMAGSYDNYRLTDVASAAVPLLAQILNDGGLSDAKRNEALDVLAMFDTKDLGPARMALALALNSPQPAIRSKAEKILIRMHDIAALPAAIARIHEANARGDLDEALCGYGPSAIAAQDELLDIVRHAAAPFPVRGAVRALGCIRSVKAVPAIVPLLSSPDWPVNVVAAQAIGVIGVNDPKARAALERLAKTHWSARVRDAASQALVKIGAAAPATAAAQNPTTKTAPPPSRTITWGPGIYDHGLPWCDPAGRMSIDGRSWFAVHWIASRLQKMPARFPGTGLLQGIGTQVFVRVEDGWLAGANFIEGGRFDHISRKGEIQDLGEVRINGIVKLGQRYFAFGYFLDDYDPAGSLLAIARSPDGNWTATHVLTLPSVAAAYAVAPGGALLLSDGPNSYAIVRNRIVPLKCEKTFAGSYFDQHPETGGLF